MSYRVGSRITCHLVLLLAFVVGGLSSFASGRKSVGFDGEGTWLIKVDPGRSPKSVAESVGADYVGPVSGVKGYHRVRYFEQTATALNPAEIKKGIRSRLQSAPSIEKFEENTVPKLYPRKFVPSDPRFPEQWHLENRGQSGGVPFADLNIREVWDDGINGEGVVVGVVDTGIQYTHPDLSPNWLVGKGYDYLGNDTNPSPAANEDRHGTAVAGITLAASNSIGVVGIAHQAKLVPLRMIAYDPSIGGATREEVADSLSHLSWEEVDVFNNSWGPSDDQGVRYAGISSIVRDSITNGTLDGRGGLGVIYVWAAGNGGLDDDNSNFDGYNSLPYTISVGAVGHDDVRANYSEKGANLLVSAPSQGRGPGILTTDNTGSSGYAQGDEFSNFNGTSAAAPMVTGVVALMLDRRPDLGWMDVQQILAKSASPVDFSDEKWSRNGAGHWVSHDYGFGRVDAKAAVSLSAQWVKLGSYQEQTGSQSLFESLFQNQLESGSITIQPPSPMTVHSVLVTVDFNHSNWGDLRIELISPSGTRSILQEPHFNFSNPMPNEWTFLSTHFLDEPADGDWRLEVTDAGSFGTGSWIDWQIKVLGNSSTSSNRAPLDEVDRDYLEIVSAEYPLQIDAFDRLSDPDGDPLEVIAVQHPTAGTLADLGNGFFEYVMGAPKYGIDTFSVLAGDGKGGAYRQIVKVINPLPIVQNDLYAITKGTSVRLPVLENDHDGDGDSLRILSIEGEFAEYAAINPDGTIQFSPPVDLLGLVRLSYHVTDDVDGQSEGQIALVIQDSAEVALKFDGVDDFARIAPTTSLVMSDNITAEAWIYPESFGEHVTGFGRIFDRDTFIFFINGFDHEFYSDRSLVLYVQTPNGNYAANSSPNAIELNKWQHVAVSYQGNNGSSPIRMYVDGQVVGLSYPEEVSSTPPQGALLDNRSQPLYMGEAPSGARAFKGSMSEFRIWSRVLSSTEISNRHDVRLGGNEPGLHLYLPLNRRLDFLAESVGSYSGSATIFEAQRVPMELPWAEFLQHYSIVTDAGTGWWRDEALGWLYGDYFPWVFSDSFGWLWTGHSSDSEKYILYFLKGDRGWMQTSTELYPWFHYTKENLWLWHEPGSAWPVPRFYDPASGEWVSE